MRLVVTSDWSRIDKHVSHNKHIIIISSSNIITSEMEVQELVDRLDRISRKYSLLINVDKTKVMANDGIRAAYSFRMNNWSRWIHYHTVGLLLQKMVSI